MEHPHCPPLMGGWNTLQTQVLGKQTLLLLPGRTHGQRCLGTRRIKVPGPSYPLPWIFPAREVQRGPVGFAPVPCRPPSRRGPAPSTPVPFLACQKIVRLTFLTFTWDLEER